MSGDFTNTAFPPQRLDVEGYGLLEPGETAVGVEPGSVHNQALEDAGALTRRTKSDTKPAKGTSEEG